MIHGTCDPAFTAVREHFAENFKTRGELGASVCVIVEDRVVVDLWGGHKDKLRKQPWEEDTVSVIFSNTKPLTAFCLHKLIDDGLVDLDAPMTRYWPEWGQNGKEGATVRHALCHQAGVPAMRQEVRPGGLTDWDYICDLIAREEPWWEPGTETGYHMLSFGWVVGEIARRVSGKPLSRMFREWFGDRLDLDLWIGLPPEIDPRVAPMAAIPKGTELDTAFTRAQLNQPGSMQQLSFDNLGGFHQNKVEYHRAEIGGGGGIGNARGLARLYADLLAHRSLSSERLTDLASPQAEPEEDRMLLLASRYGQGVMLRNDSYDRHAGLIGRFPIGPMAFGHTGLGGSGSFGDPEAKLAFGYVMNQMLSGGLLDDRGAPMVDAVYAAL